MKKRIVSFIMSFIVMFTYVDVSVFEGESVDLDVADAGKSAVLAVEAAETETNFLEEETEAETGINDVSEEIENMVLENVEVVTSTETEEITIIASGVCGENLTWTITSDNLLTISGTGAMYDNPEGWYSYRNENLKLVIEEGITRIGVSAFLGCSGFVGTLEIPKTVIEIGDYAFSGCKNLSGKLEFPSGVTYIGRYVFEGCSSLSGALEIPSSVVEIGQSAFQDCTGITSLKLNAGLSKIGVDAFSNCSSLSGSLEIPSSVTEIGERAFSGMFSNVYIPPSVTSIGDYAIYWHNTTIYGAAGSTAEIYAKAHGLKFVEHIFRDPCIVTFDSAGGSAVEAQRVKYDNKVLEPEKPVFEGYYFLGWYMGEELYDFDTPVTKDITLTAKWKLLEPLESPVANIVSGEYYKGTMLDLSCTIPGAVIYYTTDGTIPSKDSILYRGVNLFDRICDNKSNCGKRKLAGQ